MPTVQLELAPGPRTDCCEPLMRAPLTADQAGVLARLLKALADPARLRLVSMLAASPGGEACVCTLTEPLGLSQPTVSHHLKVLQDAGLVTREKRSTWAYYTVVPQALAAIADVLTPDALAPDALAPDVLAPEALPAGRPTPAAATRGVRA